MFVFHVMKHEKLFYNLNNVIEDLNDISFTGSIPENVQFLNICIIQSILSSSIYWEFEERVHCR